VDGEILTLLAIALVLAGAVVPALSLDVAALLGLALLVLGGVLEPAHALDGFGNTTLIVVGGMFVLADALQRTGAAQGVGALVERTASRGPRVLLLALLPVVMLLSAVMNNTGVVVLMIPLLIAAGSDAGISPSRLLLPLSYASITGGTLTLVGTTTTLLADGMIREAGEPGLGFFEILPMGLVFCVVALVYFATVGPALLPNREGLLTPLTAATTRQFMTEIAVTESSRLVGRRLADLPRVRKAVRFLQLVRGEETRWPPFDDVPLRAGDLLLVKGSPEDLVRVLQERGLEGPPDPGGDGRVQRVDLAMAEVMIAPRSRLDHQTVGDARMRDRFDVVVLAVLRHGEHLRENLVGLQLRVGDILLVQGEPAAIDRLARNERDVVLLGGPQLPAQRAHKAPAAIAVVAAALAAGAVGWIPLPIAVLLGCVAAVAVGSLSSSQAYRAIDLRVIVVLGCMLGIGTAARESGLAHHVADGLVGFGSRWGPHGVLAMIYLTTALLTEVVTNVGTAAIMVPIALEAAERADVNHRPFIFAVTLAASCSFLTPVGYQTNLLVYGPGGYRLRDYVRLGTPLAIVFFVLATLLLPIVYPF
jgi:di/tricarboxylate transporter